MHASIVRVVRIVLALAFTAPVAAQQAPGSGFTDPEPSQRRALPDVEPVYRSPGIDTLATIRKRGVLRVGVALSEPMVMHDKKGALVGYSIDLGRRLADDLGVRVEFVETSWTSVIPDLLARRFDVIASGLWVTAPRALVVNYTSPTAVEGIHLVVGKTGAGFKTRAEFDKPGVKIAVYAGTVQEKLAARMFPRATLVTVDGDSDHLAPVLEGRAQAALVPTFAPQVVVRSAPDRLSLPLDAPLSRSSVAMAVRKGDPDFLNFLDSWLMVQRDEGWLDERTQYWSESTEWLK